MKTLSILGSTGSIGKQALKVIKDYPDLFVCGGPARKVLAELARLYKPAKIDCRAKHVSELKIACSDLPVEIAPVRRLSVNWQQTAACCFKCCGWLRRTSKLYALSAGKM